MAPLRFHHRREVAIAGHPLWLPRIRLALLATLARALGRGELTPLARERDATAATRSGESA